MIGFYGRLSWLVEALNVQLFTISAHSVEEREFKFGWNIFGIYGYILLKLNELILFVCCFLYKNDKQTCKM